jgi:hypothetical protein
MSFFGFFGNDPKDLFLSFTPQGSTWRVVSWNFDLQHPIRRRWTLEVQAASSTVIDWTVGQKSEVRFFKNKKNLLKKRFLKEEQDYRDLMNLSIHSTLKYSIEQHTEFMRLPVTGVTAADVQEEFRALQWIQASLGTLSRALEGLVNNPQLILTAAAFSGKAPGTGEEVLRIIAFNLDIFYYFREDRSLQVVVFDDKNQGHGNAHAPVFQRTIKVTKPQFYDEIIKLLHQLASVGEIR